MPSEPAQFSQDVPMTIDTDIWTELLSFSNRSIKTLDRPNIPMKDIIKVNKHYNIF